MEKPLWIMAGPTASGKSAAALALALREDAEIISADSMQIYRGLDIATAKPTRAERNAISHHGLDLAEPAEDFSVAAWLISARKAIDDIRARGRQPLLVGGTGLYIRALIRGLADRPATDPGLRLQMEAQSLDQLVVELRRLAPAAADLIDISNRRRVERALAVALQSDASRAAPRDWDSNHAGEPHRGVLLVRTPEDLRARINARVDAMFEQGLGDEFDRAVAAGLRPGCTAWQALGYKEIAAWRAGEISQAECCSTLKLRTWQFARRQRTWFRREPTLVPLPVAPDADPESIARNALAYFRGK